MWPACPIYGASTVFTPWRGQVRRSELQSWMGQFEHFTSFPNSLWGGIWGRLMTTAVKDILQDLMEVEVRPGIQPGGKGIELMANFWYRFCFKTLITSSSVSSSSASPTSFCLWLIFNLVIENIYNRTCRNVECLLVSIYEILSNSEAIGVPFEWFFVTAVELFLSTVPIIRYLTE